MWWEPGPLQDVTQPLCLYASEEQLCRSLLVQAALPCSLPSCFQLTLPWAPHYLLQSCLAEGMPGLPQHWHLKGVLETSSEGKCILLPLITLQ